MRGRGPGDPGDDGGSRVGDASGVRVDGAVPGDGGGNVDGGPATGTDGGGSICGPGGTWECGPRDCHDRPECLARDLELRGYDAFTECGSPRSFTEADSVAACETGPPFGEWPIAFRCTEASFRGTLRFFCAPDGSEVVVRYQVHGTMPMIGMDYYATWGTDFWAGSGGGSGEGYTHVDQVDASNIYFVGYHTTTLAPDDSASLTVWFIVEPLALGTTAERFIGGGFQASIAGDGPTG